MKNRIGEINYNKLNNKMEIINYVSNKEVYVYFEKYDYIKKVTYQQFKNSEVTCPYEPRTYGIGYLGEGKYKTKLNGKHTIYYEKWKKMLQRCYDTKFQEKYKVNYLNYDYNNCNYQSNNEQNETIEVLITNF